MSERMVARDDIELWTEDFGDPDDPHVLLIMGAGAQGILWPPALIERIVGLGRHVIRYDHRDVGLSTCREYDVSPYMLDELADDAAAGLDGWDVGRAHVIGVSMGGMLAQLLMIHRRERLSGATLISTSPLAGRLDAEDLPLGPFLEAMDETGVMDPPSSKETWLEQQSAFFAALSDPQSLDGEMLKLVLNAAYDRANNIATSINHALAIETSQPIDRRSLLATCSTPTHVVHGALDPVLPLSHGQALATTIPDAEITVIDRMRHDLPEYSWDAIVGTLGTSG